MLCDKRDEAMAVTRRAANHESSHCQPVIGQMEMSAEEGEKLDVISHSSDWPIRRESRCLRLAVDDSAMMYSVLYHMIRFT